MDEPQAPPAENAAPAAVAAEDSSAPASPASEPTTSSAEAPVQDAPAVTDDTAPAETPAPEADAPERTPQRPAERRIRQLADENRQLREQLGSAQVPVVTPQVPKLSELLQGRESIDPAELDKLDQDRLASVAQSLQGRNDLTVAQLRQELATEKAETQMKLDAAELEKQPELDENSPLYNARLEQAIADAYRAKAIKPNPYNPNLSVLDPSVRLSDVAKDMLEAVRAAAELGKAHGQASDAALADNAAVAPGSESVQVKSFDDMSLAEQEAYLRAKGHDV